MYEKERRALIDCALQMKECRLITLCGGNVCMRLNNGNIAVTPSGMDYEIMTSDDVVIVTPQGKIVEGTRRPTSDLNAILYIFEKFPWVNATIHTHQPYATALGLVQDVFPATLVSQIDALRGDGAGGVQRPGADRRVPVPSARRFLRSRPARRRTFLPRGLPARSRCLVLFVRVGRRIHCRGDSKAFFEECVRFLFSGECRRI